jgi:hypothetical protein
MISCVSMMATCVYLILAELTALAGRDSAAALSNIMDGPAVATQP